MYNNRAKWIIRNWVVRNICFVNQVLHRTRTELVLYQQHQSLFLHPDIVWLWWLCFALFFFPFFPFCLAVREQPTNIPSWLLWHTIMASLKIITLNVRGMTTKAKLQNFQRFLITLTQIFFYYRKCTIMTLLGLHMVLFIVRGRPIVVVLLSWQKTLASLYLTAGLIQKVE